MKKIFIFETTNATPHLETSLEISKNHLDHGDVVFYQFLGHALDYSEYLLKDRVLFCSRWLPEVRGASLLKHERFNFTNLSSDIMIRGLKLPEFPDLESLARYKYENYNAGLSALSSLVTNSKSFRPCLRENRRLLEEILLSGISTYEYCRKVIRTENPDRIYLFNGRFANNRAILDAALQSGVDVRIHERGAHKYHYSVNHFMPHDFAKIRELMTKAWPAAPEDRFAVAKNFFSNLRGRVEVGWTSFTANQKHSFSRNECTSGPEKRLVAYFSSTDDEYVAVGDIVKWDRWPDQLSAVRSLIEVVRKDPNLELVIRLHPHLSKKHPYDLECWREMELPVNAQILDPLDPTDSYSLLEQADVVVTSGSTIGIEAVYWGKPSVCLGPSLYSQLEAVYLPADERELAETLSRHDLLAVPDKALPYGYYMATNGIPFMYYKADTLFGGRFMGVNLQRVGLLGRIRQVTSVLRRLANWLDTRFV